MLSRLPNMFRVPDLRNKILFTVLIIALYRFGAFIPLPYADITSISNPDNPALQGGFGSLLNLFSGGALASASVFTLGIMPYITSSIIMQLLGVVIPKVEQWQQEGQAGQKKITQASRYLTVVLAAVQSTGMVTFGPTSQLMRANLTAPEIMLVVLTLTAGTALIMWLGELISQRGIGNGMSLIIFSAVVSVIPGQYEAIRKEEGAFIFGVLMLMTVAVIVAIVFIESGQRRIPVEFAKRVVGRRMYGGQRTYIPLKVNQSGVIPVIFSSAVLYFPVLIQNAIPWEGVRNFIEDAFSNQNSVSWTYIIINAVLIIFFAYFYVSITFNPVEVSDNMKKYGGFIPGIRAGKPTEQYLAYVLSRLTFPGSIYLAIVAVIPLYAFGSLGVGQSFIFGGTSLLIMVGVGLDTVKQIEAQLQQRSYEGFLR